VATSYILRRMLAKGLNPQRSVSQYIQYTRSRLGLPPPGPPKVKACFFLSPFLIPTQLSFCSSNRWFKVLRIHQHLCSARETDNRNISGPYPLAHGPSIQAKVFRGFLEGQKPRARSPVFSNPSCSSTLLIYVKYYQQSGILFPIALVFYFTSVGTAAITVNN